MYDPERWQRVKKFSGCGRSRSRRARSLRRTSLFLRPRLKARRRNSLLQHDSASGLLEKPAYGSTELSAIESFV